MRAVHSEDGGRLGCRAVQACGVGLSHTLQLPTRAPGARLCVLQPQRQEQGALHRTAVSPKSLKYGGVITTS